MVRLITILVCGLAVLHLHISSVVAAEVEHATLDNCKFTEIDSGVSWSTDGNRLTAVAIVAADLQESSKREGQELTNKAMLGRYIYGLEEKKFRLSGVYVDFVCVLSPSEIVAQVSK
jgi:hypothetical protein